MARLPRSRRDYGDLAKIVEISPWCSQDSKSRQDCGEISSISTRLPSSRHDVWEILNFGEIMARYPPSRRDYQDLAEICRNLTMMFVSFWISARSRQSRWPKTRRDLGQNFAGVIYQLIAIRSWKETLLWWEKCILVPKAHDPSGLWQGSRALAGPDLTSMHREFLFSAIHWREVCESRTSGVGQSQSSWSLPQAKRIMKSGD